MKLRKIILILSCLISPITGESDYEKYQKLEIKDVASIKKSDLPQEFSDKTF